MRVQFNFSTSFPMQSEPVLVLGPVHTCPLYFTQYPSGMKDVVYQLGLSRKVKSVLLLVTAVAQPGYELSGLSDVLVLEKVSSP